MKKTAIRCFVTALICAAHLHAQAPADEMIEPVADSSVAAVFPAGEGPATEPPSPAEDPAAPGAPATPFGPLEQQKQEMAQSEEGFIIKDAGLNDIFQFLAKSAGRQYFHNSKINGPDFLVTGHLNDGNPLQQMEELAFMYGLSLHMKGNTIYALTQAQLAQLPSSEFHYQLRYLRPTDMEQIKELIKPMLSPGTGIVNFEPKTNTIVIIDSAHRIEQARELLHNIDQAKGQIIVETKILRVNSNAAERVGVNWAASLGENGTPISVIRDLNSVFGLDSVLKDSAGDSGDSNVSTNLVLSPLRLNGVLRALAEGNIAREVSNPTLITEDNEQATISIIQRIPIVIQTQSGTGNTALATEEVRYKIDETDKTISEDPDKHREIGISLVVTPTLLPDGTIRMKMRPRSAQISGKVIGAATGNEYPRVTESMVESITRVPDGYSLVLGGFYGETDEKNRNKVPFLGDLPALNFFFKSKETIKERASLVFVVTPKSYNPASVSATDGASRQIRRSTTLPCDFDSVDPYNPGPAHEPNMARTMRGLSPHQAPLYPESPDSLTPAVTDGSGNTTAKPRFARGGRR